MFIDTHAHLNFKSFDKDLSEVINNAQKAKIGKIIIPGAKLDSSKKAIEISQKYDSCFAAVGIHPHHGDEAINLGKTKIREELKKLIIFPDILRVIPIKSGESRGSRLRSNNNSKVMAIGEIGLDYHQYKGYPQVSEETKKYQKELLLLQIELAQKANLPIIFHCRDAHDDQLKIISTYLNSTNKSITGVFHCFDGGIKHLKEVLELGFYVGFDGNITYPENQRLRELVKATPLDKLLLETDSPFLTPQPFRGTRNEPSYLTYIASIVSEIHDKKVEAIAEITSSNGLKLFRL